MSNPDFPPEFLELLRSVKGKRSRIVVNHILEHGFITTEDLTLKYGYKHPPRAVRDVRDQGVPLETFSVKNAEGQSIAAYRFANIAQFRRGRVGGRKLFPKAFKQRLIEATEGRCSICLTSYENRYLQIDHRVPYEVVGDSDSREIADYMLLCGSCNRAKSWSCEHCVNWLENKNPMVCQTCYWANPVSYEHIATHAIRRLELVWAGDEVELYVQIKALAETAHQSLVEYIKAVLKARLNQAK